MMAARAQSLANVKTILADVAPWERRTLVLPLGIEERFPLRLARRATILVSMAVIASLIWCAVAQVSEVSHAVGTLIPVAQEHDLPLLGEVPEERPGRQPGALGDLRDRRLCVSVLGEQGHGGFFEDEGGVG